MASFLLARRPVYYGQQLSSQLGNKMSSVIGRVSLHYFKGNYLINFANIFPGLWLSDYCSICFFLPPSLNNLCFLTIWQRFKLIKSCTKQILITVLDGKQLLSDVLYLLHSRLVAINATGMCSTQSALLDMKIPQFAKVSFSTHNQNSGQCF